MKVLAIGAHFDDVELGCGGSLFAWKKQGHHVSIFIATHSGYSDANGNLIRDREVARSEGLAASQRIGADLMEGGFPTMELSFSEELNQKLLQVLSAVQPDMLLTHWTGDTHPDHRALARASLHCSRRIPRVLMYSSNWYESEERFDPRFFVDISATFEEKLGLIKLYQSENSRTSGKWLEYTQSVARLLGLKTGVDYAEGFHLVKWLM